MHSYEEMRSAEMLNDRLIVENNKLHYDMSQIAKRISHIHTLLRSIREFAGDVILENGVSVKQAVDAILDNPRARGEQNLFGENI